MKTSFDFSLDLIFGAKGKGLHNGDATEKNELSPILPSVGYHGFQGYMGFPFLETLKTRYTCINQSGH